MPTKYAYKGKIYNGGTYGAPTWNEIKNVRDVQVGGDFDKQDASTRAGNGIKQYEPTLLDLMIAGKIKTDEGDTTGFVAIETAFLTRAALDILVLDGSTSTDGSRGYRVDMKVMKFGEDQTLEKVLFRDFELAPCVSANAPQKAVVTSGAPVFPPLAGGRDAVRPRRRQGRVLRPAGRRVAGGRGRAEGALAVRGVRPDPGEDEHPVAEGDQSAGQAPVLPRRHTQEVH